MAHDRQPVGQVQNLCAVDQNCVVVLPALAGLVLARQRGHLILLMQFCKQFERFNGF